jgi:hypothetical protein
MMRVAALLAEQRIPVRRRRGRLRRTGLPEMRPATAPSALCANHLGHAAARLRTLAAGLRTGRHVRVVRMLLASLRTPVTTDRAAFARRSSQRTLSRRKGCCQLTALSAIGAKLGGLSMLLLRVSEQRQTVLEACVALQLTGCTNLSALHEVCSVSAPACLSLRCGGESQGGREQ